MLISAGMTASAPKVSENGVAPVEFFEVVLYDHKIPGSSSAHFPFALSSRFLSVLTMVLLVDSACPFDCGCLGVANVSLIFHLSQKSWNAKLMNCGPLSVIISCGTPNLHIIFFQIIFFTSVSLT